MAPPKHAAPRKRTPLKRVLARAVPYVGAIGIVVPIWGQIADEDTPPHILAAKTALAAGALQQTLIALERANLLPHWLDTNPDNDD